MAENPDVERVGVYELAALFSRAGWMFREQPIKDVGIDAQVEIVKDQKPTGEIIAMQVKSGSSYFTEEDENSIVFRPNDRHVEYWTRYSLPVIIVLYEPKEKKFIWQACDVKNFQQTKKANKILIPKSNVLTDNNVSDLIDLFKSKPFEQKIQKLILESEWMQLVAKGECVYASYMDWVNKSLSRTGLSLTYIDKDEEKVFEIPTIYCPGVSSFEILKNTFPWADFEYVEEDIDAYLEDEYEMECYMYTDEDSGEREYSESFEEWNDRQVVKHPIPYINHGDEAYEYRLKMKINDFGNASLLVLDYIFSESFIDKHGFRLS